MMRRLVAIAGLAALAGALAWAQLLPSATVPDAATYAASIQGEALPLACPGPVVIPVGDTATGDESLDSGSTARTYRELARDPEPAGEGFWTTASSGSQLERVASGDVAGLAGVACAAPSTEQWLVGGSTALGSSARLVLTNPTSASTEVAVTLRGPLGEIDQLTTVSVAAHAQADLLLEGVAAEVPALAVHVSASGAGVVASLQDSRLNGFQPAGTDWVTGVPALAGPLAIPFVGPVDEASPGSVRLIAPEGATVTLTLTTEEGDVPWGGVEALELEPGVVTDVPLPTVGEAAVVIEADAPLAAGALTRVARDVDDGPVDAVAYDLAWVPAAAPIAGEGAAVTGASTDAIAVHAVQGGTFQWTDATGEVLLERTMRAGTSAVLPLDVPAGTVVTAEGAMVWSLLARDEPGFVSATMPRATEVAPTEITIVPGPFTGAVAS